MEHIDLIINDKAILLMLGIVLVLLQFLYRKWDKEDTKEIVSAIQAQNLNIIAAVKNAVDGFDEHIDRSKRTHEWVFGIKDQLGVKDTSGLPLNYRNVHTDNAIEELIKLTHTVATTQKNITQLMKDQADWMKEITDKVDKLKEHVTDHQKVCTQQFNNLKDKIH